MNAFIAIFCEFVAVRQEHAKAESIRGELALVVEILETKLAETDTKEEMDDYEVNSQWIHILDPLAKLGKTG